MSEPGVERERGGGAPAAVEPERQTTPFLVLQFFVFPMAIVAVCVAVFVVFGLVASEDRDARDYLSEVRSGSANRRWQAAFELSKVLQSGDDPALADPRFVAEAVALFRDAADDDPRVRRYLAVALGRLADPGAVPVLLDAAREAGDSETRIYSVWALGSIGAPEAIGGLVELVADEDPGIRKSTAHALGAFPDARARDALARLLNDGADDVRWNAAVALGRHADPRAQPELERMLSRAQMDRVSGASDAQVEEAMVQAVAAATHLPDDPDLRARLDRLQRDDPSLKVREAARRALQGLDADGGSRARRARP